MFNDVFRTNIEGDADYPLDQFTFIDLFAGIGGTRLAFERVGGRCVFTSEWDKFAQQTYRANFCDEHEIAGDIREVNEYLVPDHDVLLAGFPCQPFSLAGVSKKNSLGRPHGFADPTQGTLFFEIKRIIASRQPAAFLLENVKHLRRHDGGRTFEVIIDVLSRDLGYKVFHTVVNSKAWVPQARERTLIVGFREDVDFSWDQVVIPESQTKMSNILHPENGLEPMEQPYTEGSLAVVSDKYTLSDNLWEYLQKYAEKHNRRGNGFGFGLVGPESTSRTLSARYYKDGAEILVRRNDGNPRRLTPRECARLMGFPDSFQITVSDNQAYRQFGNSVVVPMIEAVARAMVLHISTIRQADPVNSQLALRYGR